jgi:beta-mannosidase
MNTTIELGGPAWSAREALGDTWQWYLDKPVTARNNAGDATVRAGLAPGWLPARVPGSVVGDLARAGELGDPYVARQSRGAEWVASRSWVYRREFDAPPLAPGERAVLCFDGIDPGARVYVDAVEVGTLDGLYRPGRFDISELVADGGTHRLAVVIPPAPPGEPQVGRTDRVTRHAPRLGYGWDFCPRLVHQGIWRDVRLEIGSVHLTDVQIRTELNADLTSGQIHVAAVIEASGGDPVASVVVRDSEGGVVAKAQTSAHRPALTIDVLEPRLWWPNGLGDQHLYPVEVRVVDPEGGACERSTTVGFRHVQMRRNTGAPATALPYTAVVNGQPVELIGWNWAPADALYGDIDDATVDHLIDLAARSGARILRVWGGGLVESEHFYDACDRAGLFVWQEFSQSSSGMQSAPADNPELIEHLREEARVVVPGRTHHPALLMWGGGNELEDDDGPLDETRSPTLTALRDEVARLDPGRHWAPTSPTGPLFHNRLDVIDERPDDMHDVHGPWEHQGLEEHYTLYNRGQALAHTEFGVEGMANRRLWRSLIPEADRWPTGRENPVYRHLGDWWNNTELVHECFGGPLRTPDEVRRASQFLQATGLAYAVEADRRRWPRSSMVIPWQLAESYPNAWCTAIIDHAGEPKPAYHAVARAYLPERVTARVDRLAHNGGRATVEAWVWSEPGRAHGSQVTARLLDSDGRVVADEVWALAEPVGHPRPAGTLDVDLVGIGDLDHQVLFWELEWRDAGASVIDWERVALCTGDDLTPLLDLGRAELRVDVTSTSDGSTTRVRVEHAGGPAVVGLHLSDHRPAGVPGWVVADIDPRPLMPGEARAFTVHWRSAPAPRRLLLESWNTDPLPIEDTAS